MYDVVIIGCGIIGALTARELARFRLKICVLEAKSDVAMGASAANSGIVHAGFDAAEGSLKALYNAHGNAMMKNVCLELGVPFKNNGSLVAAFDGEDQYTLEALYARGLKNGVPAESLKILGREELRKLEPNLSDAAVGALLAKTGGIVCPYGLTIAAIGNAMDNGAELRTDFEVAAIESGKEGFTVLSSSGEKVRSKYVINCAGIYSDQVAGYIGDRSFRINARKGEYLLLDKESGSFVSHTLFSCPSREGKGVLVTPTADGNLLLGPTSEEVDDRGDHSTSNKGFEFVTGKVRQLCKEIRFQNVITSFAGVRAYSDRHDFIIEQSKADRKFINVAGIESPGLTASPAIAKYVAEMVVGETDAQKNPDFNPIRKSSSFFKNMTVSEKNALIKRNPDFGKIVCRCEVISLGEILFEASRNPIPKTVDGIKRRVRAGMGRCQGGFCQPAVVDTLRSLLDVPYEEITKSGGGSYLFTGATK